MGHYISDAEGNLTKIAGKDYKAYMPLGMIFASAVMLEEISVKRLDGQSLSITGTYKDFCNWVIQKGANAPTCNISTYASEMTTYGQCGKFVINNTASAQTSGSYTVPAYSIKLPTITEFVASNNGGDTIGLAELDEFKSHTHGVNVQQGVYTVVQNGSGDWCATYSNNYTLAAGGEETRPKNIRYPYYIVVAQGVKPIALADMQQTVKNVEELQDKWLTEGKPKIEIGVGINTGEAFVGNIGSEKRLEYTVIGDTVNLASRIESYNKVYKTNMLISSSTYSHVSDIVDVIKIADVTIRGKAKKMDIYEVLGLSE